jgi:hypothetical protein
VADHKKASDIFQESEYAFAKTPFAQAFPEIEDFTIEVVECEDPIWRKESGTRTYTKNHPPGEFVDCTNRVCYGGGVSIGEILREMIRQSNSENEVAKRCRGYEGSPKGQRKHRRCIHEFTVKVSLKYRPA